MKRSIVWTALIALGLLVLLAIYAPASERFLLGQGPGANDAEQGQSFPQFNVLDFGARGDDYTDNTKAFSACIAGVVEAGGGRMVIPDGVYRGRIIIPPVSRKQPSWLTIEIVGQSVPTPVFGTIGQFPLQNHGTIIKCLDDQGPAVISASASGQSLYGGFSGVHVVLRNLDVRTRDDPPIGGIDLQHAMQCTLDNVFINTGKYNVQSAEPTHGTSGLVTPRINNAAWTVLERVMVTGYHNGIVVNEHTDADHIVVASNQNGLLFQQAHHASRFGRVGAYRNTNHVAVVGRHGFVIDQLNTEQPGDRQTDAHNAWQIKQHDVNDPDNLATGDIHYWVVIGNAGARDVFDMNGGEGIRARLIGAASGD